jgi:hypothetical protein
MLTFAAVVARKLPTPPASEPSENIGWADRLKRQESHWGEEITKMRMSMRRFARLTNGFIT